MRKGYRGVFKRNVGFSLHPQFSSCKYTKKTGMHRLLFAHFSFATIRTKFAFFRNTP
ncbi:hypothetical protein ADIS_4382 [Lunatimonas lonarensis]|uniref:Uncharacterized protein n=1 Tax=Lunatimonas lonarensis TaxID=1232681 RepID=R7ZM80_9BACT|nr:hypothetical protein ADIS_4382 [Lunatimonas lonarensis]